MEAIAQSSPGLTIVDFIAQSACDSTDSIHICAVKVVCDFNACFGVLSELVILMKRAGAR